jgi:hypothetical protein
MFLWKSYKTTAFDWGRQALCVFNVRKCIIQLLNHVLVFVTKNETPYLLLIHIQRYFGLKVVRQQNLTGIAKHFVILTCGNACSCY